MAPVAAPSRLFLLAAVVAAVILVLSRRLHTGYVQALEQSLLAGRVRLDLHAANRLQLLGAGLGPDEIHAAPWCTHCHEEQFFSFRRDGRAAGRQMALVGARRGGGRVRRP